MPEFATRLSDGLDRALDHLPLALVPAALALGNAEKVGAVLGFDGIHVGFRFGTPLSVVSLWEFVTVPNDGVAVHPGVPVETSGVGLLALPVLLVVQMALSAGYFGSLADVVRGRDYEFVANATAFFVPFLLVRLIPLLVTLPLVVLVGGSAAGGVPAGALALLFLALPVAVALSYLFYATPYLVVLRETDLLSAARGSYALAMDGGAYFRYFVGFGLFVLVVSPVATVLVVSIPGLGLVVGLVGCSVLGLAANLATTRFVADVDPAVPSTTWTDGGGTAGRPADEHGTPRGTGQAADAREGFRASTDDGAREGRSR